MQSLAPLQQPGLQFDNSILAMDANARNNLWNSIRNTDGRGLELENFILSSNLNVANNSVTDLSYVP